MRERTKQKKKKQLQMELLCERSLHHISTAELVKRFSKIFHFILKRETKERWNANEYFSSFFCLILLFR